LSTRNEPRPICAILLAGGRARRFEGRDKGLIPLAGRPLAAWVAGRLRDQVAEIVLNANRNQARYAALGYAVVADVLPEYPGPLAGILAAARTTRQEWLLSVPCDLPFLPRDLAPRLHDQALGAQAPLVRAADATGTHYAIMLLHQDLLPDLTHYVDEGGRQVQAWQRRHPTQTVLFEADPRAFLNINTPDDLRAAEQCAPRYAPATPT